VIAEANNLKSVCLDDGRTCRIFFLSLVGKMLPTVELDHQLGRVTHEIGDIVPYRHLASEAGAVQSVIAHLGP
jgi:hypothetical protein